MDAEPIYAYSHDGEHWDLDLWEVANLALENDPASVHVERGVADYPTASDFVPGSFADFLAEQASDGDYGKWADDWLDASEEQKGTLQSAVECVVDSWAHYYDLQPKFYTVSNVEPFPIPEEQRHQFLVEYAAQTVFAQESK